ncbi:hypothetical protein [Kribbella sp. NBC_00359]|uniref:hypothetical protein n=1 Tax=Kribbella sp. NBC_00359 TaxID=2975966 RepID=UPI002E1E0E3C
MHKVARPSHPVGGSARLGGELDQLPEPPELDFVHEIRTAGASDCGSGAQSRAAELPGGWGAAVRR